MNKLVMSSEHRKLLSAIMEWYWDVGQNHISKSDYEFVYSIWNHGVSVYGKNIQTRMNEIRDKYVESLKETKDGQSKDKVWD